MDSLISKSKYLLISLFLLLHYRLFLLYLSTESELLLVSLASIAKSPSEFPFPVKHSPAIKTEDSATGRKYRIYPFIGERQQTITITIIGMHCQNTVRFLINKYPMESNEIK